jgi:hypothetical protein
MREYVESELLPNAQEWEESEEIPKEVDLRFETC